MKKLFWLFLVLGCLPNWLFANEVLDDFLSNLNTLEARFEQSLYNEKGDLLEKSQGEMYVQRPNKFRWDYQYPYTQLIVADGERVWIYDTDLEQVTVKSLDQALGKTPAFLLSSSRQIEEDFFVEQLPSKMKGVTRLELTPKDTEAQFDSMRINLSSKDLLGFELVDNLGQTTLITFRQVKRNKIVEEKGLFIFTPPAGVDIINEEQKEMKK
ncbi:outer membrane lipoprotein chaperone LolA [Candidatus Parabeggiatoa sp. HSG14]|uniref:outer membrane lipoprotein chaperone LolA n=1 Tax=Candidatus Parabeggiatoa sp. HSG14 TaxID=3055593 RepID=UPI0025A82556|nr:outer membrane lipoprotein chaperone LolA [Thiotrichales bacterium HSG14]